MLKDIRTLSLQGQVMSYLLRLSVRWHAELVANLTRQRSPSHVLLEAMEKRFLSSGHLVVFKPLDPEDFRIIMSHVVGRCADDLRRVVLHGHEVLALAVIVPLPYVAFTGPQDAADLVVGVALVPVADCYLFAEIH